MVKRKDTGIDAGAVTLLQLFKGEREYVSPLFQRQYVWGKTQIDALWEGIDQILEKSESERFLGALVLEIKSAGAAFRPDSMWIVDGQQRLTTLYITLLEMAKIAAAHNESELAKLLFQQYIFNQGGSFKNGPKIQPTLIDFRQFNSLFSGITDPEPKLRIDFGEATGNLTTAAKIINRAIQSRCISDGKFNAQYATEVVEAILEKLAFVQIVLGEEHDAHQVFDSLNSHGIRLENKDLIRNIVFQKLADKPDQAQQIYQTKWVPLEESLGDRFDGYFFPFALVYKPSTTKSSLLSVLKEKWKGMEAYEVVEDLRTHIHTYNALSSEDLTKYDPLSASDLVNSAMLNLNRMKAPTSVYAFVFRLIDALKHDVISESDTCANLKIIEAFLIRRAFAGFEPTGLHAVFKNLWEEAHGDPKIFIRTIEKNLTVRYPSDAEFRLDIETRAFYGRRLMLYVIREYERSLVGGDATPENAPLTVDHVMPQTLNAEWRNVINDSEHEKLKHVWGNLVPLSGPANSEKGQNSWLSVRKFFETETIFKTTKRLSQMHETWSAETIRDRGKELADWAIQRWPKDAYLKE